MPNIGPMMPNIGPMMPNIGPMMPNIGLSQVAHTNSAYGNQVWARLNDVESSIDIVCRYQTWA
jgi:hypothetical protein